MLGIYVYSFATSNSVVLLNCNLPLRILERNNLYILLSIRGMLWNIHKITHEEDHLRSSQYPVSRRRTGVSITLTRVLPQTILWIVRWVDWSMSSDKTEQRVSQIGIHRSISWRQTLFGGLVSGWNFSRASFHRGTSVHRGTEGLFSCKGTAYLRRAGWSVSNSACLEFPQ